MGAGKGKGETNRSEVEQFSCNPHDKCQRGVGRRKQNENRGKKKIENTDTDTKNKKEEREKNSECGMRKRKLERHLGGCFL
jgi:hypothetical protein